MGFFDFFRSVFGGRGGAGESGGTIISTSPGGGRGGSTGSNLRFNTTLQKYNETMLKQLQEARKYRGIIETASRRCQLPPSVICGIGSRESHWGLALRPANPGGTGDHKPRSPRGNRTGRVPPDGGGFGRGLMQIDYDWHEFARTGNWQDPKANLMYACNVVNDARTFFRQRRVPESEMLRAVIAAYNSGATNTYSCIQGRKDIDCKTTGRDYSRDVLNRSGWFQLHGWR
ncbi:MAG: hypothetical protein AAF512_05625 [Pseudomonadota bacterium]